MIALVSRTKRTPVQAHTATIARPPAPLPEWRQRAIEKTRRYGYVAEVDTTSVVQR